MLKNLAKKINKKKFREMYFGINKRFIFDKQTT